MTDSITATELINIGLTIGIAMIAYQTWRIATRMQWLTGAMERHSIKIPLPERKREGVIFNGLLLRPTFDNALSLQVAVQLHVDPVRFIPLTRE